MQLRPSILRNAIVALKCLHLNRKKINVHILKTVLETYKGSFVDASARVRTAYKLQFHYIIHTEYICKMYINNYLFVAFGNK